MSQTLYLIAGGKTRPGEPGPAAELYSSEWFGMARAFVQPKGPWLILSWRYGVVDQEQIIEPYQHTVKAKDTALREAWAEDAVKALQNRVDPGDTVVLLAGELFRDYLVPALESAGLRVEVPMEKLSYGQQMLWLTRTLKAEGIPLPRFLSQAERERQRQILPRPRAQDRLKHLKIFYGLLEELGRGLGGLRNVGKCHEGMGWPTRGVYFFFEQGERRSDSGRGSRVVRVGANSVSSASVDGAIPLWTRLRIHMGSQEGGRHRISGFRRLVGSALVARDPSLAVETWGDSRNPSKLVLAKEQELEVKVSKTLARMSLLCLDAYDERAVHSLRQYIERNSIALLSNAGQETPLDPPSEQWLGHDCPTSTIPASGLWNPNYVEDDYDPAFLDTLRVLVSAQLEGRPHRLQPRWIVDDR